MIGISLIWNVNLPKSIENWWKLIPQITKGKRLGCFCSTQHTAWTFTQLYATQTYILLHLGNISWTKMFVLILEPLNKLWTYIIWRYYVVCNILCHIIYVRLSQLQKFLIRISNIHIFMISSFLECVHC